MISDKLFYTWDDFESDVKTIVETFGEDKPHIVGIHRGSLPLAVKLSNIFGNGMSIMKFQSRDGNDKSPSFLLNEFPEDGPILIVDDIVDSGLTFQKINFYLNGYGDRLNYLALLNNNSIEKNLDIDVITLGDTFGKWVVFPWE